MSTRLIINKFSFFGIGCCVSFSGLLAQQTAPTPLVEPVVVEAPAAQPVAVVEAPTEQPAAATPPAAPAVVTSPAEEPAYRNLDAALYMHSSAEYHAMCIQAYNWATERVEARMEDRDDPRPAAVVLDLDETVINNGAYQSWQIQQNFKFDQKKWTIWEDTGVQYVTPIPGSQAFIARLKELNIQPIYITNRDARAVKQTMEIMDKLNMGVPEECLLCADAKTGSSKTTRRESIAAKYEIILLVGDNLRDFDEVFKYNAEEGVEGRKKLVEDHLAYWGKRWIVLPNPAYGEWTKPLGKGMNDTKYLMPAFPSSSFESK